MATDLDLPAVLEKHLRDAGISYSVEVQQPLDVGGAPTVPPEWVVKTLVYRDRSGRFVLAALPADGRVSYAGLARAAGVSRSELRPAAPADLALLGMEPGGATPLCFVSDALIIVDEGLTRMGPGRVHCGTGRAGQSLILDAADMVGLVRSAVVAEINAGG